MNVSESTQHVITNYCCTALTPTNPSFTVCLPAPFLLPSTHPTRCRGVSNSGMPANWQLAGVHAHTYRMSRALTADAVRRAAWPSCSCLVVITARQQWPVTLYESVQTYSLNQRHPHTEHSLV